MSGYRVIGRSELNYLFYTTSAPPIFICCQDVRIAGPNVKSWQADPKKNLTKLLVYAISVDIISWPTLTRLTTRRNLRILAKFSILTKCQILTKCPILTNCPILTKWQILTNYCNRPRVNPVRKKSLIYGRPSNFPEGQLQVQLRDYGIDKDIPMVHRCLSFFNWSKNI